MEQFQQEQALHIPVVLEKKKGILSYVHRCVKITLRREHLTCGLTRKLN